MERVILFFGDFNPLDKRHISLIENAIKKVKADKLYIGINKGVKRDNLAPFYKRKAMINIYKSTNKKVEVLNFSIDYNSNEIKDKLSNLIKNKEAYFLIEEDKLPQLTKINILNNKVIVGVSKNNCDYTNSNFIYVDAKFKHIDSSFIINRKYYYTLREIKEYIISNNLYLKEQIKPYFESKKRYLHTLSVAKTALYINKNGKLGLDKHKVEKACLLHDIAKDLSNRKSNRLMKDYYSEYLDSHNLIIHQYLGEYLARKDFFIEDIEVLNAIKYHTTGRKDMTLIDKIVYVSDKIEPRRKKYCNCYEFINLCINDFDEGFVAVLNYNKDHLDKKGGLISKNKLSLECFNYYLK